MKKLFTKMTALFLGAATLFGLGIASTKAAEKNAVQTNAASTVDLAFGSGTGSTKIDGSSVTTTDSLSTVWTIATAGTTSFTQNASYSQIGSSKSAATSVTFTGSVASAFTLTSFSMKFGGFSGTAGTVTVNVGSTSSYATGKLSGTSDVTVSGDSKVSLSSNESIVISLTSISKGIKVYSLSYSYTTDSSDPTLTSVSIEQTENIVKVGGSKALSYTYKADDGYSGATTVTWSSSDSTIATVDGSGNVSALKTGTATITIKATADETITNSVNVLVLDHSGTSADDAFTSSEAASVSKYIGTNGTANSYYVHGLVTSGSYDTTYNNGTYVLDNVFTVFRAAFNSVFTASDDIQVNYYLTVYGQITLYNTTCETKSGPSIISIVKLSSIKVTTNPTKMSYQEGESFDSTGMVVSAVYDDGTSTAVTDYTYSPSGSLSASDTTITISYSGLTTALTISVSARTISSIAVTTAPTKTSYYVGSTELDTTGLVVTATYSTGDTANVTTACTFSDVDFSTAGTKTVTVTHTDSGKTATFEITVKELEAGVIADGQYYIATSNVIGGSGLMLAASSTANTSSAPSAVAYSIADSSKAWTFTHVANDTYSDVYTIKCGTMSLYATNSNNGVRVDSKTDDECIWRIVQNSDEVTYTLYPIHANVSRKLACYNSADWRTYTGTTGVQTLYLNSVASIEAAATYSNSFLSTVSCSGEGSITATGTFWNDMKTAYAALDTDVKAMIKTAVASESTSDSVIQQCVARYDYIVNKYTSDVYEDFMTREPSESPSVRSVFAEDNTITTIFTLVAISSITIVGGLTLSRKRKEF